MSVTGGNVFHTDFVDVGDEHYPAAMVVTPGHNLVINYTFSTSGNQGTMEITWYELPLDANLWV